MGYKTKLTQDQVDFLKNNGTEISAANGESYYYIHDWFKSTESCLVYEVFNFETLPDELIELIKMERGEPKEEPISSFSFNVGRQIEGIIKEQTGDLKGENKMLLSKIAEWYVESKDEKFAEYFWIKQIEP